MYWYLVSVSGASGEQSFSFAPQDAALYVLELPSRGLAWHASCISTVLYVKMSSRILYCRRGKGSRLQEPTQLLFVTSVGSKTKFSGPH